MVYEPALEEQLRDGCPCPSKDCAACAGVMLADRASVGRWRLDPCAIRRKAGVSCTSGTGGIPYSVLAAAIQELTDNEVRVTVYGHRTRAQCRSLIDSGRPGILSEQYSVIRPTRWSCSRTFGGGHAMSVNDIEFEGQNTMRVGDPLADGRLIPASGGEHFRRGWAWIPADLMFDGAEARGGGHQGDAVITICVANDTEAVDRKARISPKVRAEPKVESRSLGRLKIGKFYHVISTRNGGPWVRDTDGGTSHGWHRIRFGTQIGYVKGEALV